jgi:hypothetical protein
VVLDPLRVDEHVLCVVGHVSPILPSVEVSTQPRGVCSAAHGARSAPTRPARPRPGRRRDGGGEGASWLPALRAVGRGARARGARGAARAEVAESSALGAKLGAMLRRPQGAPPDGRLARRQRLVRASRGLISDRLDGALADATSGASTCTCATAAAAWSTSAAWCRRPTRS